jgi:hypothetical protein
LKFWMFFVPVGPPFNFWMLLDHLIILLTILDGFCVSEVTPSIVARFENQSQKNFLIVILRITINDDKKLLTTKVFFVDFLVKTNSIFL